MFDSLPFYYFLIVVEVIGYATTVSTGLVGLSFLIPGAGIVVVAAPIFLPIAAFLLWATLAIRSWRRTLVPNTQTPKQSWLIPILSVVGSLIILFFSFPILLPAIVIMAIVRSFKKSPIPATQATDNLPSVQNQR